MAGACAAAGWAAGWVSEQAVRLAMAGSATAAVAPFRRKSRREVIVEGCRRSDTGTSPGGESTRPSGIGTFGSLAAAV